MANITVNGKTFKSQQDADIYFKQLSEKTPETIRKEKLLIDEKAKEMHNKFMLNSLKQDITLVSVPLGLSYYCYYKKFSLTKGVLTVVLGSGVFAIGAIWWSFNKDRIFSKDTSKEVVLNNRIKK